MLDILCVGDSVIDIFLRIPQDNPHFGLDKEKNKLMISLGEKINVEKYVLETGGNATNTAVGLSRFGLNSGICAEIGKDEFSQKILSKLNKENVNTDLVLQTETEKTSFSVVINYNAERTIFSEHVKRTHDFNFENVNTKFIYLTSLGNIWEDAYRNALKFAENKELKLAFNPGTLQLEKRDNLIFDIVEKTDFLFLNKEEAEELLYGKEISTNGDKNRESLIKKMLFGLRGLGAKNIIITDSNNGSYVYDDKDKYYKLGILDSEIVEKTGAGDSYTAGFLGAIINNLSTKDAMVWGSINASSVVEKIGAQEGLLTKTDLMEKAKSNSSFSPKDF
jgi:ribokinase